MRERRPSRVCAAWIAAAALGAAAAAGCGGSAATPRASTARSAPSATTATSRSPDVIAVTYAGGALTGGGRREVTSGDRVTIQVTSDVADEVHLHGYDRKVDVAPGAPASLTFTADIPGVFEVELESRGVKLIDLVVR